MESKAPEFFIYFYSSTVTGLDLDPYMLNIFSLKCSETLGAFLGV